MPSVENVLPLLDLEDESMGDENATESDESDASAVPDDATFIVPQPSSNELGTAHRAEAIGNSRRNVVRAGLFPMILDRTANIEAGTAA